MLRSFTALGAASVWMVAGRASGLVWTLFITATLGVGDLGAYASAYALAAIVSAPIENFFVVRGVRVNDDHFRAERSLRALIGLGLAVIGFALYAVTFFVGFALIVAGLEMIFNAYKSLALREGRPGAVMRADAIRQISSIVLAAGYVLLAGDAATLSIACLLYVAPYAVVLLLTARLCIGHRPRGFGNLREHTALVVDALVLSVYLQGDILLLGVLADDTIVGYYSIASQVVLAASTIGQLYGQQFSATLRQSGGSTVNGPSMRLTVVIGLVLTLGAFVAGGVFAAVPNLHVTGLVLLVIAPFAGLRAITNVWVTVLYVRGVDVPRFTANVVALALRLALLTLLTTWIDGAFSAAVAAVVGEIVLVVLFAWILRTSTPEGEAAHAPR